MSFAELTEIDKRILSFIRKNPNQKRTRISELTKIPWTTATTSIDKLERFKMILTQTDSDSIKNTLRISDDFAYLLGVSIGTSHIKVCVLDFSFSFAKRRTVLDSLDSDSRFKSKFWKDNGFLDQAAEERAIWCANTPSKGLLNVKRLINDLCDFALDLNQKINVVTIGFSFPGHVDNKNGIIIKSSNLDFALNNVGMNTIFTNDMIRRMEDSGIKICFEHNVKAAAIAEKTIGAIKNQSGNCAVLYFGTGLGVAFWLDGKLYRGRSNAAGQLGHIKIDYVQDAVSANKCSCGDTGCLEEQIRALFGNDISVKESTGKEIAAWLDSHEDEKIQLVDYLTRAIFNISYLLEIDCVVFSGKLSQMYESIENLFQEKMILHNQANMQVITSNLGEYSASVGTAIYGYYNLLDFPID